MNILVENQLSVESKMNRLESIKGIHEAQKSRSTAESCTYPNDFDNSAIRYKCSKTNRLKSSLGRLPNVKRAIATGEFSRWSTGRWCVPADRTNRYQAGRYDD